MTPAPEQEGLGWKPHADEIGRECSGFWFYDESMKNRTLGMIGLAILPVIFLVACSSTDSASAAGTWGVDAPGQPQLVLADDGTLSGTDGCNRLTGSWKQGGDRVELYPLASTMMFCEGVDTWLVMATDLEMEDQVVHVFDAEGTELGTLERQ